MTPIIRAVDRGESARTALLFAAIVVVAYANVVLGGESLLPGNNANPLGAPLSADAYGPDFRPVADFAARDIQAFANIHDPSAELWQGEPARELLSRALRRGEFPLWDPTIGGGVAAMANLTPAFLFPPTLLIAAAGNPAWLANVYILLLVLTSGWSTYALLRKHDVGVLGSRAAGIAFMFSGAVVQTTPSFIGQAVVGIPITLLATAWVLERPTWFRTILAAFAYAFVSLASFPPVLLFSCLLCVCYGVTIVFLSAGHQRWTMASHVIAAVAMAAGMVAFYYLPVVMVVRAGQYASHFYRDVGLGVFQPKAIFQLLSPTIMGGAPTYETPVIDGPAGNLFYIGISALLLSLTTFGRAGKRPLLWLFQVVAIVWTLKLFGVEPFQQLGRLPIVNAIHLVSYGGILLSFVLACLAGFSLDAIGRAQLPRASALGSVLVAGLALLILWRVGHGDPGAARPQFWRWIADYRMLVVFLVVGAALLLVATFWRARDDVRRMASAALVAMIAVEGVTNAVFIRQPRWNYWNHPPSYVRELLTRPSLGRVLPFGVLPANTNSPFGIASVDSLFTFNSDRYGELHRRYFGSENSVLLRTCTILPAEPVLDAFAVTRILINPNQLPLIDEATRRGFARVFSDSSAVLFERRADRFFLTRNYIVRSGDDAFYDVSVRQTRQLVLEATPGFESDSTWQSYRPITVESFRLNSYRLRVSASRAALLYAAETDAPGWTARVNGVTVPIHVANYAFRAIEVPEGESVVEFSYWPPGMTAGIAISSGTLLIAFVWAVVMTSGVVSREHGTSRFPKQERETRGSDRPRNDSRGHYADGRVRTAFVLVVLCGTVYLANARPLPLALAGDTVPTRLIPFSILRYGRISLEPFRGDFAASKTVAWYVREEHGQLVSMYPIGGAFAALPFYVPTYAYLWLRGKTSSSQLFRASEDAEKLASGVMVALAVGAFYLTVRRRLAARQAFWAAIAFGLGSLMWGSASQMLWQQSVVAVCVAFSLWFLSWPAFPAWAAATAGGALGLAVATRASAGILLLAGLATAFVFGRRAGRGISRTLWFAAAAVPLIAAGFAVNYYFYGYLSGIYGDSLGLLWHDVVTMKRLDGIAGLLISPNRGLLIFTPIALVGIWGLVRQVKPTSPRDPLLVTFGLAAFVHLVMFGSYEAWYAGSSFGTRYLVEITPVLALAGADAWPSLPQWARRAALALLPWCIFVEFIGAFCYPASQWFGLHADHWQTAVWDWTNFQLWQDFRAWLHHGSWVSPW